MCGALAGDRPSARVAVRERGAGLVLRALLALLHVLLDLALLLLALLVRATEHLRGHLAAAEAEREGEAQSQRADQSRVGDLDDLRRDLELVEDHEDRDPHHKR